MSQKNIKHYTIEEILKYLNCSLCHHLEYNLKVIPTKKALHNNKNNYYKEALSETVAYYYRGHTDKKPPSLHQLYNKFYQLWMAKNGTENENSIFTRSFENAGHLNREAESKYVQSGYESIKNFFNYNNNTKQSVLAYNYTYEIPIKDAVITGVIPLIREVEIGSRREVQLVVFSSSRKKPNLEHIKINLDYILQSFAFNHTLRVVPDKFIVYYLARDEEVEVYYNTNDYKRLFATIEGFVDMVNVVKPFPTAGVHTYSSLYKDVCDSYDFNLTPTTNN